MIPFNGLPINEEYNQITAMCTQIPSLNCKLKSSSAINIFIRHNDSVWISISSGWQMGEAKVIGESENVYQ